MPTPFLHLALAEDVLREHDLSPNVQRLLDRQPGPFLLGSTAPDVQTISGQARIETHYYTLPRTSPQPAYQVLFDAYPALARAQELPPAQAAFVAGYITHLTLDELWLDRIFVPYFWDPPDPHQQRALLHNALRTWLDERAYARLDDHLAAALRQTKPRNWLPFICDSDLLTWRDWLVEQLTPGHHTQTAEVFARRMGIPTARIEALIASPVQMAACVFRRVPHRALHAFQTTAHTRSVALLTCYLDHAPHTDCNHAPPLKEVYA